MERKAMTPSSAPCPGHLFPGLLLSSILSSTIKWYSREQNVPLSSVSHCSKLIKLEEGGRRGGSIYSWSIRSTGDPLDFCRASETGGGRNSVLALSPYPVGSITTSGQRELS